MHYLKVYACGTLAKLLLNVNRMVMKQHCYRPSFHFLQFVRRHNWQAALILVFKGQENIGMIVRAAHQTLKEI